MTTSAITLEATARDTNAKAKDLRKQSRVPGVLYGHQTENQAIECDYQEFHKVYVKAGESTVVDLKVGGKSTPVLIHRMSLDPVTNEYEHVDFFAPDMTKEVTANVPITLTGESLAVKDHGGVMIQSKETLTVKCLPKNLPNEIVIDISVLEDLHDSVTVADVKLAAEVTLQDSEESIIVTVQPPRAEEVEEVAPAEGEAAEGDAPAGGEAAAEGTATEGDKPAEGGDAAEKKE